MVVLAVNGGESCYGEVIFVVGDGGLSWMVVLVEKKIREWNLEKGLRILGVYKPSVWGEEVCIYMVWKLMFVGFSRIHLVLSFCFG